MFMSIRLAIACAATVWGVITWWVIPDDPADSVEIAAEVVGSTAPHLLAVSTTTTSAAPAVATVEARVVRGSAFQVLSTTTIAEPLPEWDGLIPAVYGEGSGCTRQQATIVAWHVWMAGGSDLTVEWMLQMMSRESTCDPAAHNGNRSTGDDSYGLCQINRLAGWFDDGQLLEDVNPLWFANDFDYNVAACVKLWRECGKGPWNYGSYYCSTPEELR